MQAQGRFALAENGPEGRITVTGEAFEVVDTEDAHVLVSPDLALALDARPTRADRLGDGALGEIDTARGGAIGHRPRPPIR